MPHESLAVFWHTVDYQQCMDAKKMIQMLFMFVQLDLQSKLNRVIR